ncbi:B3 domain-containing transcription factor VRN1 [Linum perenne]
MAANNNLSKHFWQVIYPNNVEEGRLRLAEEFMAAYGRRLSNVAVLKLPDGKAWKIGLQKEDDDEHRVWLNAGFRRFLQYYSIDAGFLLMFEFQGSSTFDVLVFDLTACEIDYPISPAEAEPQHSMDLEMEDADSDSECDFDFDEPQSFVRKGKRDLWRRVEASSIITNKKFLSVFIDLSAASKRAIERAIESNPTNPSFLISILPYHLTAGFMNFPADFTKSYTWEDSQQVALRVFNENEERMLYEVLVNMSDTKNRVKRLTGWMSFCKDNHLKEGDVCLFELIDPADKLFTVRKFHARNG